MYIFTNVDETQVVDKCIYTLDVYIIYIYIYYINIISHKFYKKRPGSLRAGPIRKRRYAALMSPYHLAE